MIIALRELRPSVGDKQVCAAWLEVMHSCCFVLAASNEPRTALDHLPQIIDSVLLLMDEPDLAPQCSATLQKCFIVALRHLESHDLNRNATGHQIIVSILQGITYKYAAVIDSTMDVLGSFYSSLPNNLDLTPGAIEFLLEPLDGLKQLRANPLFTHRIALDTCVGEILSVLGPRHFLSKLPMEISGNPEEDGDIPLRCGWLLPIMESKLSARGNFHKKGIAFIPF